MAERGSAPVTKKTIQPGPEGKDACIKYYLYPDGSKVYKGFSDESLLEFIYYYWGPGVEEAALIEFPLSTIPKKEITSAKLRLYGMATINSLKDVPTINLLKLLGPWNEATVKWNTKPSSANISKIDFVNEGRYSWYEFDVTSTIQKWVNGEPNHGFEISTSENSVFGKIYSGDNPDVSKRPMLIVSYR